MLTEFGDIAYATETPAAPRAWGYTVAHDAAEFGRMYAEIMQIVIHIALFSGFCYTQFADTFQEANGLVRADSHVKDSARADCAGDAGLTHPHHRRRLSPAGSRRGFTFRRSNCRNACRGNTATACDTGTARSAPQSAGGKVGGGGEDGADGTVEATDSGAGAAAGRRTPRLGRRPEDRRRS